MELLCILFLLTGVLQQREIRLFQNDMHQYFHAYPSSIKPKTEASRHPLDQLFPYHIYCEESDVVTALPKAPKGLKSKAKKPAEAPESNQPPPKPTPPPLTRLLQPEDAKRELKGLAHHCEGWAESGHWHVRIEHIGLRSC